MTLKKSSMQPEHFQSREVFIILRLFDKHFFNNTRKKVPQGKILDFFLLFSLKTTF